MFPSRSRKNLNGLLLCFLRFGAVAFERVTLRTGIGFVSCERGGFCKRGPSVDESTREANYQPLGRALREHYLPWDVLQRQHNDPAGTPKNRLSICPAVCRDVV